MIETSRAVPEGLEQAFCEFSAMAERVRAAYEKLQETAARLDRDLADANVRLRSQVDELENLSGSLAAVLRAIPSGVVVSDREGVLLMMNPAAERILGVDARDVLGRRACEVEDARGAPLLTLHEGPGKVGERFVDTARGPRIVAGCVVTVTDAVGEELGLVEVIEDRSEVKALEEEVRRLDRLAELGRVAAIIAHEIRNPLSGIRGFAGMLERRLREGGDEDATRWAGRICEGVERADAIIDSVLFLARPRSLDRRLFCLDAFLAEIARTVVGERGLRSGLTVRRSVSPPDLAVRGDRMRLGQAVSNLLHNALDATGERGVVELFARADGDWIEIGVEDDGPGVAPEARDHLFEPFFTTRTEGAGLGLALVRRIAELHRGTAEYESPESGGARFVVRLPAEDREMEAQRK